MHRLKILLFFLLSVTAFGQSFPLSDKATVSVLTCGSGPELYSLFGHTAIRIKDPVREVDIVYNYGAFDFQTPNFALKFVKGDMQYFVTSSSYNDFIIQYDYERRSVAEQVLNIPQEKKQQLFEELNSVLFSDKRFYTYKFIDRNCTNMAMDIINKTLGGKVLYKRKNTATTYRKIIYPYFDGHFYEQLGTSIIFGAKVDEQASVLFLPIELQQSLAVTTYNNKPLAPENRVLVNFKNPEVPFSWWNNPYTYLAFLALVVLLNRKNLNQFYVILCGLLGLFFTVDGLYSLHEELAWNYNVLLFNPALLALVYFYAKENRIWIYRLSAFCLITIVAYLVVMINKPHFLIVLPMVATHLVILIRLFLANRRRTENS